MNFNSIEFLIFFPVVLVLYWLLPHKLRWVLLLIASYYFYMSWNTELIFLIFGTTFVSYLAAVLIEKTDKQWLKRLYLIITLVVCLGVLFFFKYFNFVLSGIVAFLNLFSMNISSVSLDILLPVGISFYTFQTLSYVIDVYRGDFKAEKHFGYYALFVSYFPQLVAGPIESAGNLLPQLREKHYLNEEDLLSGLRIMLCGFFRKCVVADFLGIFVNKVFANVAGADALSVFVAGALFCLQMYCDFAGYSEIAMGAARMMGVKLMINFDRPYLSQSYTEFFRRWHISLNKWFTDYLYIPLGGNRKGKVRKVLNTVIVFTLCGLWHGADVTYVLWGLYAAFFVSVESIIKKPVRNFCKNQNIDLSLPIIKFCRRAVMFLIFIPAALVFRASSVGEFGLAMQTLFTKIPFGLSAVNASFEFMEMDVMNIFQIAVCIICMCMMYNFGQYTPEKRMVALDNKTENSLYAERTSVYLYMFLAVAFCWLALLASDDVSAFQYFQF